MLAVLIMIICALDFFLAISDLNYPLLRLITLIMGQLTVGGHWKWFHSISRPKIPYHSHQNFDSRSSRKKVSLTTYDRKAPFWKCHKNGLGGSKNWDPPIFL